MDKSRWDVILQDYDAGHRCNELDEITWFRRQPSLRRAIQTAARAVDARGRRFSHQCRIQRQSIAHANAALVAAEAPIKGARSFEELLSVITGQLREVSGIGPLYRYDTAFRIGAHLGLFPARVYLHAGTRDGARALGLSYKKEALDLDEVPAALRNRPAHEIEDILCIYKDVFAGGQRPAGCVPKHRRGSKC